MIKSIKKSIYAYVLGGLAAIIGGVFIGLNSVYEWGEFSLTAIAFLAGSLSTAIFVLTLIKKDGKAKKK